MILLDFLKFKFKLLFKIATFNRNGMKLHDFRNRLEKLKFSVNSKENKIKTRMTN